MSLLLLLVPLLTIVSLFVVDVAQRVETRLSLQIAADRAAYAGAASLRNTLNDVAGMNWRIHRQFADTEYELTRRDVKRNRTEGENSVRTAEAKILLLREAMDTAVAEGYRRACEAAVAAATRWAPGAHVVPLYGGVRVEAGPDGPRCVGGDPVLTFGQGADADTIDHLEEGQWPSLHYCWTTSSWFDPEGSGCADAALLAYRMKGEVVAGRPDQTAFAVRLDRPVPASAMPDLFPHRPLFHAAAAAQPYGGSIRDAGLADVATAEAAVEQFGYHPTLVPLAVLRDADDGYRGLAYWDDAHGWSIDDTEYLH